MKRYISPALFAVSILLSGVRYAEASVIHVPADYSTIQAAIDASSDGDEIVVSPGTYTEAINIYKLITVRSTFDNSDWSLVENTILKPPSNMTGVPAVGIGISGIQKKPTVRGIHITRDPISAPMSTDIYAVGVNGNANVEFNIIENQVTRGPHHDHAGAGIVNCNGTTIKNNIIRNNYADSGSAMANCGDSTITNNLVYGSKGGSPAGGLSGRIINNTFYNNDGGLIYVTGIIANNILWVPEGSGSALNASSVPSHCLIRGYTGPGTGNLDADPQFVDPANGDFHLKSTSPCIDAGSTSATAQSVKADFEGVQRGLQGKPNSPPEARHDIGAYEYIPKPVAVWLQNGSPDEIHAGDTLAVGWQSDLALAGTAVDIQLFRDGHIVQDFGAFYAESARAIQQIMLGGYLTAAGDYSLKATSAYNPILQGESPPMAVVRSASINAVKPFNWERYAH